MSNVETSMSRTTAISMLLMGTLGAQWGCEPSQESHPDGGVLPTGYEVRLDRSNRDPTDFDVSATSAGLRITTGPSGILYRSVDTIESGDYAVSATITEVGAPVGHREGAGLFIGGQDLQSPNQRYTYFLVRADGRYLIKRRFGSATSDLTDGWLASGVLSTAGEGDVVNELRIQIAGDRVQFHCNGARLAELPAADLDAHGIVGVRVNHNLDVQVAGFAIER